MKSTHSVVGCAVLVLLLAGCVAAECRDGSHSVGGKCVADDRDSGQSGSGGTGGASGNDGDSGLDTDAGSDASIIDECATDNGGCDPLTTCVNTGGARACGVCPLGYGGDGASGCVDIDECADDGDDCELDPAASCVNTAGTFSCECPNGFLGDGHGESGCLDVDECMTDNGGCDMAPMVACTNTIGGRMCGTCPPGYAGDGVGDGGCVDIDECATNNGGCDVAATCSNILGSFSCGACPAGYTGNGAQADGCVAQLSSLRVNPGLSSASFSPSTLSYSITAGLLARYVEVIAATSAANATITVGGQAVDDFGSRFQWIGVAAASVPVTLTDAYGRARTYTLTVNREGSVGQRAYVKPPTPVANQQFGRVIATDGDTLAVSGSSTGQAFGVVSIFARTGTSWVWQADLSGTEFGPYNWFGRDGLDVDGDTLVVGQSDFAREGYGRTGAVHVYVRVNGAWSRQATLVADNGEVDDLFGRSVAISGDRVVVGAPAEDASSSGGPNNNTVSGAGAVYVFARRDGAWTQERYLKALNAGADDAFGTDVDLYRSLVVVGSPGEDGAGVGANPSSDNLRADSGAIYLYERSGSGAWSQVLYMKNTLAFAAVSARLGASVAMGNDTHFVAGAPGAEAAYVFHSPSPDTWVALSALAAADSDADNFGASVAMWGPGTVVVSAAGDDSSSTQINGVHDNDTQDSGASYVFLRSSDAFGSGFGRDYYVKARNSEAGDGWIGADARITAIAYDTVVTGAPREDSMAGGIEEPGPTTATDDDPSPVRESGAAYIFR